MAAAMAGAALALPLIAEGIMTDTFLTMVGQFAEAHKRGDQIALQAL